MNNSFHKKLSIFSFCLLATVKPLLGFAGYWPFGAQKWEVFSPTRPEHPFYFNFFGGADFLSNKINPINDTIRLALVDATIDVSPDVNIDHKVGYHGGGAFGFFVSDDFRIELQGMYIHGETANAFASVVVPADIVGDDPPTLISPFRGAASISITSVMVNVFYDFIHLSEHVVPFIGLGVGGASLTGKLDGDFEATTFNFLTRHSQNDTDTQFAWQFFTGFRYNVANRTYIQFGYRYFQTNAPKFFKDRTFENNMMEISYSIALGADHHHYE